MVTPQALSECVKTKPFRPFRIHMASGQTFDVKHPEMIKVLKSYALVFKSDGYDPELFVGYDSVWLMLAESITNLAQ